jgi:protein-tyrosine phosphatase
MIDFHTHILYDIDDGPRTLDVSVEMARVAVADGITTMVATPHAPGLGRGRSSGPRVRKHLEVLRAALHEADVPLEVLPGNELFCDLRLLSNLQSDEFLTCNDTHTVLVECPIYEPFPSIFPHVVADLQTTGYQVVLAHPERIRDVMDDPNALIPYIERGVLMQLTSQALTGVQGERMMRLAETLVTHDLVHMIATDAHNVPPYRPPILSHARQRAVELVGAAEAQALVYDTPGLLVAGRPYTPPPPRGV